jgi:hypothetical protein
MFMKTFEERFTAWIDGQLEGEELVSFEQELIGREDAMSERANVVKLGALLREHGAAPALTNQDFFNNLLMERIYSELPTVAPKPGEPARQKTWWGLPKIVWVGAACLVASMVVLPIIVPNARDQHMAEREVKTSPGIEPPVMGGILKEDTYEAEVLEAISGDPTVSVVAVKSADNNMTVVWLDGLNYIPASNPITASKRAN